MEKRNSKIYLSLLIFLFKWYSDIDQHSKYDIQKMYY